MTWTAGTIGSVAVPVWSKLLLLAGILCAAVFTAQFGYGQTPGEQPVVEDVLITGLRTLSPQQVKAQLRTIPGQPYNPALIQEDL